ncbi:MAG TPA: aminotransferase class V-fold PLP-dependent enzyme [Thermoleophilaceae bacterium]
MDTGTFRAGFPVVRRLAYLNAGTNGPVPRRAAGAAAREVERETVESRAGWPHFERIVELASAVRERIAARLGCDVEEVALTRSTTDGMATALALVDLGPGDEVLTSDEEHGGLLAPLEAARRRRGFEVRTAPFAEIAGEVGPRTRLVACSHVSWISGRVVDAAALAAADALVLLDGAQGLGAVDFSVRELGCDFYGAAGQKWLCGPEGTGCLYVRRDLAESLIPAWPSLWSLSDLHRPSELPPRDGAQRFDLGQSAPLLAWSLASLDVLGEAGWEWVTERGPALAGLLAEALAERGHEVVPRDRTTLVAWRAEDTRDTVVRLAGDGVVIRDLPGRGLLRASVGAWSTEDDLERLVAAVSPSRS